MMTNYVAYQHPLHSLPVQGKVVAVPAGSDQHPDQTNRIMRKSYKQMPVARPSSIMRQWFYCRQLRYFRRFRTGIQLGCSDAHGGVMVLTGFFWLLLLVGKLGQT